MSAFKQAAQAAWEKMPAHSQAELAHVERLSVEVGVADDRQLVSLWLREGALSASCTCGHASCAHAYAALALLCQAPGPVSADRVTDIWLPQVTTLADRRTVARHAGEIALPAWAEILQDLLIAVVRSGASAELSPSVEDGLTRLMRAAPSPLPLGLSRWVGRFKSALAQRDAAELACVLAGADMLIDDMLADAPTQEGRRRMLSWLVQAEHEVDARSTIADVTLVEIAREQLAGATRAGIQRRYLIDAQSGHIYREECVLGMQNASLGPCPRLLTVSLASVEVSAPPSRLRLYQYAVTPAVDDEILTGLLRHATTDFSTLVDGYAAALAAFPALSEPFVLVAPARVVIEAEPVLFDAQGVSLPLAGSQAAATLRYFETWQQGAETLWVAGRLVNRNDSLALVVLSAIAKREGRVCYAQL